MLQPLDVGCFGPLKKAYGRQIENKIRVGVTHISEEDFFLVFAAAFQETMTVDNIQGGFRGTGLIPHNPEAVLSKLDIKLKTPTPPGSSNGVIGSWTSRTPTNSNEATSQSQLLKDRISCHQGSSPTSIYEGINHLLKGAHAFIHRMTLLEEEVKTLRETNNLLSRRRRTKKQRLRQGGAMTVAEGQDQMAQNEVNVQVKQETQQGRGRGTRSELQKRRCSVCGNTGHNARTCQVVISLSEEDNEE